MQKTAPLVDTTRAEGVLEIALDSPPYNILDHPLIDELESALSAAADEELGAVLLHARGKGFCAGVSVEDHLPDRVERMLERFVDLLTAVHRCPIPTVGVLHGTSLGGGLELACALDVLFAAPGTRLGQPEIKLAAIAPAALCFLPRRVGFNRAADLLLTGRTVTAEEAAAWSLVDFVANEGDVLEQGRGYARKLAGASRPVLRAYKEGLLQSHGVSEEELRAMNSLYLDRVAPEADYLEGITAFLEHRRPTWRRDRT